MIFLFYRIDCILLNEWIKIDIDLMVDVFNEFCQLCMIIGLYVVLKSVDKFCSVCILIIFIEEVVKVVQMVLNMVMELFEEKK